MSRDWRPDLLKILDRNGNTLLHVACCVACDDFGLPESASTRMAKLLLDRGLEMASWCWKQFAAAKFLAINGANVNFQDKKGRTALHHGIEKEFDPALLTWLVIHGASPDIPDGEGVTARAKASRKRDRRYKSALAIE